MSEKTSGLKRKKRWVCKCDCGNIVDTPIAEGLKSGNIRSCGCLQKEWSKRIGKACSLPYGEAAKRARIGEYQRSAKLRELEWKLTYDEAIALFSSNCYYCGVEPSLVKRTKRNSGEFKYNGIDRIDSKLGYLSNNVVACCKQCNYSKFKYSKEEFLEWIKRVYNYVYIEGNNC